MAESVELTLPILICAAVNAHPPLAAELSQLALAASSRSDVRAVQEVFAIHGGEKFGERDNNHDLATIREWLSQVQSARRPTTEDAGSDNCNPPSIYSFLDDVMPPCNENERQMVLLKVNSLGHFWLSAAMGFDIALGRQWAASDFCDLKPSLLFVHGPMPVSTLDGVAAVDFDHSVKAENRRTRAAELETVRKQHVAAMALGASVGIPHKATSGKALSQSLQAIKLWLSSPSIESLAETTGIDLEYYAQTLVPLLARSEACWEKFASRIDEQMQRSSQALYKLERTHQYVLRAFVVEGAPLTTGDKKQYVAVRRFGKAQGASHYSVLGSDGICQPTRLKDIQGTVIESMWVCCSDDEEECRAKTAQSTQCADPSLSQSGLNTVVADPDDEIFCDVCLEIDSWSYNQIIICDGCERGLHQFCHAPVVTESELTQDQWFCQGCKPDTFNKAKRRRSK
ncbi:mitochondrial transcription factor 2 [Coemansia sp. BCRC 34301]|nr:mitochondrial transcription factor 2 [Coemansia sp. BCRC 34301]